MNENQQKKQKIFKYSVFSTIGIVFLIYSAKVTFDYIDLKEPWNGNSSSVPYLPMDGIDPKEIWVDQIRTENEIVQEKVNFIETMLVERLQEEGVRDVSTQNEITKLRNEIINLKSELKSTQSIPSGTKEALIEEIHHFSNDRQQENWDPFINSQQMVSTQMIFSPLSSVSLPDPENLHHINRSIPTGTSVKAILLSSVDMPCSVNGSSDPLPVKLRIIDNGRLPHKVRARLKSGIVTASVYGDLSSERVYFRLEKLTQVRPDGYYIETQVAGYVSGEDGKYGLRGTVVDKSSQLVENALLSGFLSGTSNFFESAALSKFYPNGCFPEEGDKLSWKASAGQLGIAGGSQGVTNALDALTNYFIKRAEQLRPVIQISPGRIIDITFSENTNLGDLYTHEKVRQISKNELGETLCDY